jgi:hypothetical protein
LRAYQSQQRSFTGAARSHDSRNFTLLYLNIHAIENRATIALEV